MKMIKRLKRYIIINMRQISEISTRGNVIKLGRVRRNLISYSTLTHGWIALIA